MKKILLVVIPLLILAACSKAPSSTQKYINSATPEHVKTTTAQEFFNPDFPCPTEDIVEPDQGFPHPVKQSYPDPDYGEKSVADLKEFCERMKQRFAEAGISGIEAGSLYEILSPNNNEESPLIQNECYGMPLCDVEPFVIAQQVMLKKISSSEYELFYYWIGCGINYHHMKVTIAQGTIRGVEIFERWSESFPC